MIAVAPQPDPAPDHLDEVAFRIHQAALELLATTSVAQNLVTELPPSVAAFLEGSAAAAALIAQLSCQLQLELGSVSDDLGPDPPVSRRAMVTGVRENRATHRKR